MAGHGAYEHGIDCLFKNVLIGYSGVGKTNLLSRFTKNEFSFDTRTTIGVDFADIMLTIDGKVIKAQIWDTAGQDRFCAITGTYYRGALGVLLVYDVTRHPTFENVLRWLQEVRDHSCPDLVVMLIGNNSDLRHLVTVSTEEGKQLESLYFMDTSALEATNVNNAFTEVITQIHRNMSRRAVEAGDGAGPSTAVPSIGETIYVKPDQTSAIRVLFELGIEL